MCVWGVCVRERERWSLSVCGGCVRACVCVCVAGPWSLSVCVLGGVRVCVCRGVLGGGCNLSVHGFIIER